MRYLLFLFSFLILFNYDINFDNLTITEVKRQHEKEERKENKPKKSKSRLKEEYYLLDEQYQKYPSKALEEKILKLENQLF